MTIIPLIPLTCIQLTNGVILIDRLVWYFKRVKICTQFTQYLIIGYWLDMEIYVRVLVRNNIARRQERNIYYAPEQVHITFYT